MNLKPTIPRNLLCLSLTIFLRPKTPKFVCLHLNKCLFFLQQRIFRDIQTEPDRSPKVVHIDQDFAVHHSFQILYKSQVFPSSKYKMQIFQRLFKVASVQGAHQNTTTKDQEDKPKDIVSYKKRRSKSKKFKPIIFLCNKDIAKACFYSSIYLRKVNSSPKTDQQPNSQSMMKIKKQGQNSDSSKVLPLSLSPSSSNISSKEKKQNKLKGDNNKTKPMSRMKELLRWAAASTKSEKGEKLSQRVMNLKNRDALKAVSDDDRLSSSMESPKISFSTSFSSSSISGVSVTSSLRNDEACNVSNSTLIHGLNGCSTDSEFVVLELSG